MRSFQIATGIAEWLREQTGQRHRGGLGADFVESSLKVQLSRAQRPLSEARKNKWSQTTGILGCRVRI